MNELKSSIDNPCDIHKQYRWKRKTERAEEAARGRLEWEFDWWSDPGTVNHLCCLGGCWGADLYGKDLIGWESSREQLNIDLWPYKDVTVPDEKVLAAVTSAQARLFFQLSVVGRKMETLKHSQMASSVVTLSKLRRLEEIVHTKVKIQSFNSPLCCSKPLWLCFFHGT